MAQAGIMFVDTERTQNGNIECKTWLLWTKIGAPSEQRFDEASKEGQPNTSESALSLMTTLHTATRRTAITGDGDPGSASRNLAAASFVQTTD